MEEKFNYNLEKHLEFIESNISRMNKCSFQMKGWTLTIISALLAVYATEVSIKEENTNLIYLCILPTSIFWVLDSYYLSKEKKFMALYKDVAQIRSDSKSREIKPYDMSITEYKGGKYNVFRNMFSMSEWILYLILICIFVLFAKYIA